MGRVPLELWMVAEITPAMVETRRLAGTLGNRIIPGVLRWCRNPSIRSMQRIFGLEHGCSLLDPHKKGTAHFLQNGRYSNRVVHFTCGQVFNPEASGKTFH